VTPRKTSPPTVGDSDAPEPASTRKRANDGPFAGVTLEQVRHLVAVADAGSFTAGAKRVGRAQSAVSQSMATLEAAVGFRVWDRSERTVMLTERGRLLVAAGRRVLMEMDRMRELCDAFRKGPDERLSLAVDAIFPPRALVKLAEALQSAFPALVLRLETDTLASVSARVARRDCDIGIAGPLGTSDDLERVAVGSILMIPVAAPNHPLARGSARAGSTPRLSTEAVSQETQIVLSEHGGGASPPSPDQGVISHKTWRVVDLSTKRELILGGLGWGNLPAPSVREDLEQGRLVRLELDAWNDEEHRLPLALVFRPGVRRRPIVGWLLEHLPGFCEAMGVGLRFEPENEAPKPKRRR
jgi:DNA-binding transcriptional LysR family regulator